MYKLEGKVALVTGAGGEQGIGRAIAARLAAEGADLVINDVVENPYAGNPSGWQGLPSLVRQIEGLGRQALHVVADVSVAAQVEMMVQQAVARFGHLDILVANAGSRPGRDRVEVVDLEEEDWDLVQRVNGKGVFLTCRAVLPHMERQGSGAIVNISSVAGIRYLGIPYISYSTTKAAILQLTQSIAVEYAAKNIRANAILPGLMHTPLIEGLARQVYGTDTEKMLEIRSQQAPMKKMGDAWDVAYAALFLASDEAKYITGIQLVVDGGLTCKVN